MKIDLTALIQAIIALIAALIAGYVIPWVKSKTTANQQNTLIRVIQLAVGAAEQLYGSKTGQEKKKYVLEYLQSKGFDVDDTFIEGIVGECFGTDNTDKTESCAVKSFIDSIDNNSAAETEG